MAGHGSAVHHGAATACGPVLRQRTAACPGARGTRACGRCVCLRVPRVGVDGRPRPCRHARPCESSIGVVDHDTACWYVPYSDVVADCLLSRVAVALAVAVVSSRGCGCGCVCRRRRVLPLHRSSHCVGDVVHNRGSSGRCHGAAGAAVACTGCRQCRLVVCPARCCQLPRRAASTAGCQWRGGGAAHSNDACVHPHCSGGQGAASTFHALPRHIRHAVRGLVRFRSRSPSHSPSSPCG